MKVLHVDKYGSSRKTVTLKKVWNDMCAVLGETTNVPTQLSPQII